MPRVLVCLLLLALLAAPATAAAQGDPFAPLPPAPQVTPAPPVPDDPAGPQDPISREVLLGIAGAVLLIFVVLGWYITRDARSHLTDEDRRALEREGAQAGDRGEGERRPKPDAAKRRARAKGRAQRRARRAQRRR